MTKWNFYGFNWSFPWNPTVCACKLMVGRWLSFWDGLFLRLTLVSEAAATVWEPAVPTLEKQWKSWRTLLGSPSSEKNHMILPMQSEKWIWQPVNVLVFCHEHIVFPIKKPEGNNINTQSKSATSHWWSVQFIELFDLLATLLLVTSTTEYGTWSSTFTLPETNISYVGKRIEKELHLQIGLLLGIC